MKISKEIPKELLESHWKDIHDTLVAHEEMPELILIAEHHYLTAARHFWKHAVEACEEARVVEECDGHTCKSATCNKCE